MVHRFPNCTKSNTLLQDFLYHTIGHFDDDHVIDFSQWTTTDRSNLTHHTETVNKYVNIVIEQLLYSALLHIEMSIKVFKKVKI